MKTGTNMKKEIMKNLGKQTKVFLKYSSYLNNLKKYIYIFVKYYNFFCLFELYI